MSGQQARARHGNRNVRAVKIPARKVPNNHALRELIASAEILANLVEDNQEPRVHAAHRRLEQALGPFVRTANEIG
jgi:hypothetical protein